MPSSIKALPTRGTRALNAYDEFLGILGDSDQREQLSALGVEDAQEWQLFKRIAELGKEFEAVSLRCCSTIPSFAVGFVATCSSERPDQTGTAFRMAA